MGYPGDKPPNFVQENYYCESGSTVATNIFQHMAQFMLQTHCGMVKNATLTLVKVAVHRLACHGLIYIDVLGKINKPIKNKNLS